eukprot:CAMPEP_0183465902 /NCGR_PEP_ID=MMETSP0370-20130417/148026_1 /TAXON_ID=268820 /ORGANISM="Peridinium aciculiferum, Strain PAER-2" /LENGTH=267 /DNA_ID=CAMNT_0025658141 /DNA_START=123 /DNA_END=926 /DNA_ORIENTATION=+
MAIRGSAARFACPVGHGLRLRIARAGCCNGCQRFVGDGEQVMECRTCNWYLCESCRPRADSEDSGFWEAFSSLFGSICNAPPERMHLEATELVASTTPSASRGGCRGLRLETPPNHSAPPSRRPPASRRATEVEIKVIDLLGIGGEFDEKEKQTGQEAEDGDEEGGRVSVSEAEAAAEVEPLARRAPVAQARRAQGLSCRRPNIVPLVLLDDLGSPAPRMLEDVDDAICSPVGKLFDGDDHFQHRPVLSTAPLQTHLLCSAGTIGGA